MKQRRRLTGAAAFIGLLAFLVYLPALRNGFVNWDDNIYVYDNHHIRSLNWAFYKWALTDSSVMYWHPFTKLSHAIDYALYGLHPAGHHLTNIILHAGNTFLVVWLVVRLGEIARIAAPGSLSRTRDDRSLLVVGGITGVLFGLHPLHVESVAWVSERKDLLCALFFLLSVIAYIDYASVRKAIPAQAGARQFFLRRHYLLSVAFFLLALASKPMAVTLPLVLALLDWYPLQRTRNGEGLTVLIAEKTPFLACGLGVSVATFLAQRSLGALTPFEQVPLSSRVLVASGSVVTYLRKMVLPVDLAPLYAHHGTIDLWTMEYLGAVAVAAGVTAYCFAVARKRPLLPALWGYYLITLLPVLGLVQAGEQSMADRFTYLPSIGPFLLAGAVGAWLLQKAGSKTMRSTVVRPAIIATALLLVGALAIGTSAQIGVWKDSMTLWNRVIEREPGSALAYVERGWALRVKGERDRALEDYTTAMTLDVGSYMAYNGRGEVFRDMGRLDDAIEDFSTAIMLNPRKSLPYANRGLAFAALGERERAIEDFSRAIELQPDHADTYMNRGIVFAGSGKMDQAIEDLTSAIRLDPENYLAYTNRGTAYGESGQTDRGLSDYASAITIDPGRREAYRQRGLLYRDTGQCLRAIGDFSAAIKRNPSLMHNYLDRGSCFRETGEIELAKRDYQRACDLGSAAGCAAFRQ